VAGYQDAINQRAVTIDRGGCAAVRSKHSVIARLGERLVAVEKLQLTIDHIERPVGSAGDVVFVPRGNVHRLVRDITRPSRP
jgi:hypothetical protein